MVDYAQLLILGAIAGFTIFLGLPLAALQSVSARSKGFLNAVAIGILVFLIIDVFSNAWQTVTSAVASKNTFTTGLDLVSLLGGLGIGLLGLAFYEARYMKRKAPIPLPEQLAELSNGNNNNHGIKHLPTAQKSGGGRIIGPTQLVTQAVEEADAYRLSMMIAIGIGAHNFSEGLAIGQSYISGAIGLALILVIGFGFHNATEGFGIAGPLTRLEKMPSAGFLATVGLVGGGPTFLGTLIGSLIGVSDFAYILFLSIAGGALVYVSMLMYNTGRRQTTNSILMVGIFVGLCAGFLTDLIVTIGGA